MGQGLINTVELALDWHLPISDEMFDEYIRLINRGQQSEHKVRQFKQNKEAAV